MSKIANHFGYRAGTAVARPVGQGAFYMRSRTVIAPTALTFVPGESGTLRGFRPADHPTSQFGSLTPDRFGNFRVWQLTGGTGTPQNYQMRFANADASQTNIQIPGMSQIDVDLQGYGLRTMVWEPGNGRYNYLADPATENIFEFLGNNLGSSLSVGLSL